MKLQYLGDSKDCFKWDYHHFLAVALGVGELRVDWMMTPDDGGRHGGSDPRRFPGRPEVVALCERLRASRDPDLVLGLPASTGANYLIRQVDRGFEPDPQCPKAFVPVVEDGADRLILLDPDNGLEPDKGPTDKHLRFSDLGRLLDAVSPGTVVSVFQHHRRRRFVDDLARIRVRLPTPHSTAIYWQSLMFVCCAGSAETVERVRGINRDYATQRPVQLIG